MAVNRIPYDFMEFFDYRDYPEVIEALTDKELAAELQATAREEGFTAPELMALAVPEPDWAIKGWLATGLNGLLAGQPKTFKSTMMLDMAVSLSTGKDFLGLYPVLNPPSPVIYIQEENTMQDMRTHFISLYERMNYGQSYKISYPDDRGIGRLHHYYVPHADEPQPRSSVRAFPRRGWTVEDDNLAWLKDKILDEGIQWVFIDPLYKITPAGMTLNSDETISLMTRKLDALSEETGANILIVHHQNKSKGSEGGHRVMGSNLIWGWAGQTLWVDRGTAISPVSEIEDSEGNIQSQHRIKVEHDFRSMAPPRNHTWLEYSGKATWNELTAPPNTEDWSPKGPPPSDGKAEFLALYRSTDGELDETQAHYAKRFGVSTRTIRTWKEAAANEA